MTFREKIQAGQKVVGIWQTVPSLMLCDVLTSSEVDFIIFDMEHSVFDFKSALEHCLLCKAKNVGAVIRVSHLDKQLISLAYDIGADVIQIPNIKTADQLSYLNSFISYDLEKGYSPFTVSENYTGIKNRSKPLIAIHIENREMMDSIQQVINYESVDIFFFGLFDISRSYKLLGDVRNPLIIKDVRERMQLLKSNKKRVGLIVNNVNDISSFKEYADYITFASDVFVLKSNLLPNIIELKS